MKMKIDDLYQKVERGEIISEIDIQRDIIYDDEKQKKVIDSIMNDIPLPAFYFWDNTDMAENERGKYEVLDGRQRLEAIKKYRQNLIQYEGQTYKAKDTELQAKFDNTELTIIICSGTPEKKREIFNRINTLGVPLNQFEVLNGLFNGEYIRGVRRYGDQDKYVQKIFGRDNARGKTSYKILLKLKEAKGFSDLKDYIEERQNASFEEDQQFISKYLRFVCEIFDKPGKHFDVLFRLALKHLDNRGIWRQHKDEINKRLADYLQSDDPKLHPELKAQHFEEICLSAVNGITVDKRRCFTKEQKQQLLEMQPQDSIKDGKYMCAKCKQHYFADELQVDHIKPWSKGGPTELSNAALLCNRCNPIKGDK